MSKVLGRMEPEYLSPPKTLSLPLIGEGSFDFFATWQRIAGVSSLEHLPPVPYAAPPRNGLAALLEMYRDGEAQPVSTREQWHTKQDQLRRNLEWLVGRRSAGARHVSSKVIFETACAGYTRRKVHLQIEREVSSKVIFQSALSGQSRRRMLVTIESDSIPAYLCVPTNIRTHRPAVICLHQFNPEQGARESIGLDPDHDDLAFADELARRGFVTLAIDLPGYGERRKADSTAVEQIISLYRAEPQVSLLGRMAWEVSCAVDYLTAFEQVDAQRIGCVGHLLGGIVGLFAAALDERLRAVVASAACSTFASQLQRGTADQIWYTGTGLLPALGFFKAEKADELPIEYHEIMAQIAPRPLFLTTPLRSEYFPREGMEEVARHLDNLYAFLDSPEHLSVSYPHYYVYFPEDLRETLYQWLMRFL